ncbi:glycosyltransferase [Aliarcobacter cryaerophilus]|uniref:glycosyltransferase n=1 Tax=Aliarcobacter cryaerophilus TaxID=28198 RepID=UPI0021B22ACA|nr:glycosyltransferase [Aliarcobacter cryaerophilus]MCT7433168.1 glycosyltransferase [Aliarcobacter cryaerophilus]
MFRNEYKIIKKSGLFDEKYYLETYEDVRKADIDPIKHYIKDGWKKGRKPSANFDTNKYLEKYPELRDKNICPLIDKIINDKNTKKVEQGKLIKNIVFNFNRLIKQLNKHNFRKLVHHIKKGNFSLINEKIHFYTDTNIKGLDLKLENTESYEILKFNDVKNPLVSIIIPVYNQFDFTYKCLKSILRNTQNIDYEIIIADDVSSDETININNYVKNIQVVRNERNLGFLLNCNNAVKFAKGKYIHLLNNDTQVQAEWLSSLIKLIESDDKIGMVGSKLVYPDGRQQEAGGIIWNDASGWNFGRLDDPTKPEYNYVKEVDYISGASILLSKKLWDEIGGFDERYIPAYFEDSDLAFEIRKHGYKVMFQPKSVVVHFEGISNGTDLGSGIKKYQVLNKEKFIEKWKDELEKNHFPNAENVFLARDRSRNKKHILVIDHYVPHFDQDAGSRTVFGYIKMFLNHNYKVTFIGDNYYKHEPYSTILEQLGVEILYGSWYATNYENWLNENLKYFQYTFLNRPHISEKYIDILINNFNGKIIYYGHDLHFLRDMREYDLYGDSSKLKESNNWRERELKLMRKAFISFYPSEVEVEKIKQIDKSINVKSIPAYLFEKFNHIDRKISETSNIMFVGGFSHTPNVDAILWFVNSIWIDIKEKLPNIKLYIIGSKPTKEILSLDKRDKNIIVTGFISDNELKDYYSKCRIAIVPLRYGAGIKGKVVEALYEQIPIVTTSIGSEGLYDASQYMIIEDDSLEFGNKIVSLYQDENKLKELSLKGNQYCEKYFSYHYAKEILKETFKFGENI